MITLFIIYINGSNDRNQNQDQKDPKKKKKKKTIQDRNFVVSMKNWKY